MDEPDLTSAGTPQLRNPTTSGVHESPSHGLNSDLELDFANRGTLEGHQQSQEPESEQQSTPRSGVLEHGEYLRQLVASAKLGDTQQDSLKSIDCDSNMDVLNLACTYLADELNCGMGRMIAADDSNNTAPMLLRILRDIRFLNTFNSPEMKGLADELRSFGVHSHPSLSKAHYVYMYPERPLYPDQSFAPFKSPTPSTASTSSAGQGARPKPARVEDGEETPHPFQSSASQHPPPPSPGWHADEIPNGAQRIETKEEKRRGLIGNFKGLSRSGPSTKKVEIRTRSADPSAYDISAYEARSRIRYDASPHRSSKIKYEKKIFENMASDQRYENKGYFHSFETVQIMSLQHQQHQLIEELRSVPDEWNLYQWNKIQHFLSDYPKALKRLQCTMSLKQLPWEEGKSHLQALVEKFPESEAAYKLRLVHDQTSFVDISRSQVTDPLRKALHNLLPEGLVLSDSKRAKMRDFLLEQGVERDDLTPRSQIESKFVDRVAKFLIALAGGSFLLVPIIVMSFVDSQNIRLIVASMFIVGFSLFLGFLSSASDQEILGGSAAYAAVLVVFIGSALSRTTS